MGNIHLMIVAFNIAIKYYSRSPDGKSRSLVLLLLSLLVCDIERIIEGNAICFASPTKTQRLHLVELSVWFPFDFTAHK